MISASSGLWLCLQICTPARLQWTSSLLQISDPEQCKIRASLWLQPKLSKAGLHDLVVVHSTHPLHRPVLCCSSWPTPPTAVAWRQLFWLMSWRQPWPQSPSTAGLLLDQAAPQSLDCIPPSLRAPERCPAPGLGTCRKLQVIGCLLAVVIKPVYSVCSTRCDDPGKPGMGRAARMPDHAGCLSCHIVNRA